MSSLERITASGYFRPPFVTENICNMQSERLAKGLSIHAVSQATGIKNYKLKQYEDVGYYPAKSAYNRLAELFGWRFWTEEDN